MTPSGSGRGAAADAALDLHSRSLVVDAEAPTFTAQMILTPGMIDLARRLLAEGTSRSDIKTALGEALVDEMRSDPTARHSYMGHWEASGVTVASSSIYDNGLPWLAFGESLRELALAEELLRVLGGAIEAVESADDIERIHRQGKHGVIHNLQNTDPFEDRLDRVDLFHRLGVRIVQLTYNLRNRVGDGCLERTDGGLSRLGVTLVKALNERGILIDLSHCSDRTALDVARLTQAPIACTHTGARALSGHARAKPDDVLRAVADTGGFVGVLLVPFFLREPDGTSPRRARPSELPAGCTTLDDAVDHIEYMLELIGPDCVGLATDWSKPYQDALNVAGAPTRSATPGYDWVGWRPQDRFSRTVYTAGMERWDDWPNLTTAMLTRGIPQDIVIRVLGTNFLRVFRAACGAR